MWKMILSCGLIFCLAVSTAYGYADPGDCSGDCNIHDPALIRRESDGLYFRFSTHNSIEIATAEDLSGPWTNIGSALPDDTRDLWAPDVSKVGDYYYMYYAISTNYFQQASEIRVARSETMEPGTWEDLGQVVSSKSGDDYNAIDPNFIATDDGNYLTFGSFWQDIYQYKLESMTEVTGDPVHLTYNSTGSHPQEAAYVFHKGDYYYLFFSGGPCCSYDTSRPDPGEEYHIIVCRSSSVSGPYEDQDGVPCLENGGTTIFPSHGKVYGPGGQGVYHDPKTGEDILYYHYVHTDYGYADAQKRFGWNNITWVDGWPTV